MKKYIVKVNGIAYEVEVEETASFSSPAVAASPAATVAPAAPVAPIAPVAPNAPETPKAPAAPVAVPANGTKIEAPLPGTVVKIVVSNGQQVKSGEVLCLLEAMKLENEILSTASGKVSVIVSKGASVNSGDLLFVIE